MKQLLIRCMMIYLVTLSLPASAARWWDPNGSQDGSGMDLDSYKTFEDDQGYAVTSVWLRSRAEKTQSVYNPNLGKTSLTSAYTMLLQVRCDTRELKLAEFIFQDRQYRTLWRLSQYPDVAKQASFPRRFNQFFYVSPTDEESPIVDGLCQLKEIKDTTGIAIRDLPLDEHGQIADLPLPKGRLTDMPKTPTPEVLEF